MLNRPSPDPALYLDYSTMLATLEESRLGGLRLPRTMEESWSSVLENTILSSLFQILQEAKTKESSKSA